mmetsp:Transcript_70030/g.193719  ORF Transcript_70030/g.193719 Transcript_70030/m.193719 type:complete len:104 (+) Transcript_70030:70-381(+)
MPCTKRRRVKGKKKDQEHRETPHTREITEPHSLLISRWKSSAKPMVVCLRGVILLLSGRESSAVLSLHEERCASGTLAKPSVISGVGVSLEGLLLCRESSTVL